ncbi:MAG TPA: hypothetical protein PLZ86_09165 [bacterium]|nr:hypothetical protein [bacterium]
MCAKSVTPDIFGETHLDVWVGKLPFAEESRFQKFKDDYDPYMMSTSNFFTAFIDAVPIGLAFSAPYWIPLFVGKAKPAVEGVCKKVADFFKRPPKDPPAGGSSGGDGPKSDIIILPGDPEFTMKREAAADASALALLGYALVDAAKAAVPFVKGALSAASSFMIMPAPVMEQMMDPDRGLPPDA